MPTSMEEAKEDVRAANDIVDVIGNYITVKRAGSTFKALCPFHREKTPSFNINQQRQSYHCFGCGASGDVFKFIMEHEGVDFMTSLKMLAERAGISLNFSRGASGQSGNAEVLRQIHAGLADLYHGILKDSPAGRAALDYLESREIDRETIAKFKIGYAPNRDMVLDWARKKDFNADLLDKAGVLIRKGPQSFDRFKGRIIFPICDQLGRVIGFSGRIFDESQSPAKYLNSPETPIFKKSRVLYGLHLARKNIIDTRRTLLCEGQIDCIRCHMHGFENAVAPQGTALTAEQSRTMKRLADQVVLLFDSDAAGRKAALRSSEVLLAEGLDVAVASVPDGTDPDTLLRGQGPAALEIILAASKSAVAYLIEQYARIEDLESSAGIMRASRGAISLISKSDSAVMRDQMKSEAAKILGVSESAISKDLSAADSTNKRPQRPRKKHSEYPPEELQVLLSLYQHPHLVSFARDNVDQRTFSSSSCRKVFDKIISGAASPESGVARAIDSADEETLNLAARLDVMPTPATDADVDEWRAFRYVIMNLWRRYISHQRDKIKEINKPDEHQRQLQSRLTYSMVTLRECMKRDDWNRARETFKDVSGNGLT